MHVLFVHQNFPAQFRHIAPLLARRYGWRCSFATRNALAPDLPDVERIPYRIPIAKAESTFAGRFERQVNHATGCYAALQSRRDVQPDLVVAHSGFGSSLFLPHLYDAPIVNFFEYFFRAAGQRLGYRPEEDVNEAKIMASRLANAMILFDLENCDQGWCPNRSQRDTFPREYHEKLKVQPEGIDTDFYRRPATPLRRLPNGKTIDQDVRVVTYVARGFELTRGFDLFMKAARLIAQSYSNVVFIVVGGDRCWYGTDQELTDGRSLREHILASGDYDLSRFHFTGWLPERALADVLAMSDLHFYLTVPWITSWSLLDAMSSGCVVLASNQACVREYIRHGENGLLCDFFDVEGMAEQAVKALRDPASHRQLRHAARRTIEAEYSLDVCLPRIKAFFESAAAKKRTPSLRSETLLKEGIGLPTRLVDAIEVESKATYEGDFPFDLNGKTMRPSTYDRSDRVAMTSIPKTILFTWELGGGLGHLLPMLPMVEELVSRGHDVFLALHDLSRAAKIFGGAGVRLLQAPVKTGGGIHFAQTRTHAHILANIGWGDEGELFGLVCAWRHLYEFVQPDLIIFDHSPTAMLAARESSVMRKAIVATGFFVPPDVSPWPSISGQPGGESNLAADETKVMCIANRTLARIDAPPLSRLANLYSDVDETFLSTFPELDHYASHRSVETRYWGPIHQRGGIAPAWPDVPGPRVFAYLKPFKTLSHLLTALRRSGWPTLVVSDGIDPTLRQRLESPALRFVDERLDLSVVGRECTVAIHNANHGTLCQLLLAGKPMLQFPVTREQMMLAQAVDRLGASITLAPSQIFSASQTRRKLDALITDPRFTDAASAFAQRYAKFDGAMQRHRIMERVEDLLCLGAPSSVDAHAAR